MFEQLGSPGLMSTKSSDRIPAAVTDIGCERDINEDRYAVIDSMSGKAWIVCDGMGGAVGGELAAQLAIDAIRRGLEAREFSDAQTALRSALEEANRVVVLRRQNPAFSSMGTTVVGMLLRDDELVVANVGDSRAYLIRGGNIRHLTTDHTYVQELVERGMIAEEDALSHPHAHVLTRCLGAEPRLEVDVFQFWLWPAERDQGSDKLVLCSDGLYSLVTDEEIASIVAENTPQESCVRLVELAKARGGYDNITLAVIPLNGTLKEEEPKRLRLSEPTQKHKRKTSIHRTASLHRPTLNWKQRAAVLLTLFLLGSLTAFLITAFQLIEG